MAANWVRKRGQFFQLYFEASSRVRKLVQGYKDTPIALPTSRSLTIGVLALQGAYQAHVKALESLGVTAQLVRTPEELVRTPEELAGALAERPGLDGLIMPGGESTTMLKFLEHNKFLDTLESFVRMTPTFGTCAGAILLAKNVEHPVQRSLGVLDVTIERNAYGRQIDSCIVTAQTALEGGPLEMVFIRAPRITRTGPAVETLAARDGFPVLVRQGHLLAATFHPELSEDRRIHQLFLDLVRSHALAPGRQSAGT